MGESARVLPLVHAAAPPGYLHEVRAVHKACRAGVRSRTRMGASAASPSRRRGAQTHSGNHSRQHRESPATGPIHKSNGKASEEPSGSQYFYGKRGSCSRDITAPAKVVSAGSSRFSVAASSVPISGHAHCLSWQAQISPPPSATPPHRESAVSHSWACCPPSDRIRMQKELVTSPWKAFLLVTTTLIGIVGFKSAALGQG